MANEKGSVNESCCNICGYWKMEADKSRKDEACCRKCGSIFKKINAIWVSENKSDCVFKSESEEMICTPS